MIKLEKCSLNRLHITTVTLAEDTTSGLVITTDFAVFNNEGTGEGCSGKSVGPWSTDVMEKVKALNKALEKELMGRFSNKKKEEEEDGNPDGGSVRGIPGGLRPKLGGGDDSIEQL